MQQRYFVVENEDWKVKLTEYYDKLNDIQNKRIKFMEDWGSNEYVYTRNLDIIGLKDPRTFDPPKELPAGWRKLKSFEGFVEPAANQVENRKLLSDLAFEEEIFVSSEILGIIAKLDPKNAERLGTDDPKSNNWFGYAEDLQSYAYTIGPIRFAYDGTFLMLIPDSRLDYEAVPGLREITYGEYQKMFKANEEWLTTENTDN